MGFFTQRPDKVERGVVRKGVPGGGGGGSPYFTIGLTDAFVKQVSTTMRLFMPPESGLLFPQHCQTALFISLSCRYLPKPVSQV